MAFYNNPFDMYLLSFYSGAAAAFPVVIQVYQVGTLAGRIAFVPDGLPLPANAVINPLGTDIPAVYFPLSRLESIVTTIRYEKPLSIFLDTASGVGIIATTQAKLVGAQEGV
ncbi:MAG: hypothetical protein WCF84_12720 [Anaerolineae bacterium]